VNPKSTSNQSSKPCTVIQYPSRNGGVKSFILLRVVPSEIQNLERKRGQYQDSWVFGGLFERNVDSKHRYLRNVWKEPCRGFGIVTFVTYLRFISHFRFCKKLEKIRTMWQKSRIVTKFKSVKLWHFENVAKCHKMSHAFKSLVQHCVYLLRLGFAWNASYSQNVQFLVY